MRIVFTLLLIGSLSQAYTGQQECEGIDLRAHLGEVRSQGNKGWCYANVAADLTSFYYGTTVSSSMMAFINNYVQKKGISGERGFVDEALRQALRPEPDFPKAPGPLKDISLVDRGFCLQKYQNQAEERSSGKNLKEKIDSIQKIKTLYDAIQTAKEDQKEKAQKEYSDYVRSLIQANSIVKTFSKQEMNDLLIFSTPENFSLYFADLICRDENKLSKHLYPPTRPEIESENKWGSKRRTSSQLISEINQQLSKNNIVSVDYKSGFLQYHLRTPKEDYVAGAGGVHASVIVGREWINNQCHYIIRNSWGSLCGGGIKKVIKGKEAEVIVKKYSPAVEKCEQGNLWVSEKVLLENIHGITYIKK